MVQEQRFAPRLLSSNSPVNVPSACGRLCLYRRKINLSTCLAGQAVGIKEVDDGIWLVSFMHYHLGYVDLEEKTLLPLPNPFWSACIQ
jgi:hypothetical protein